MVRRHVVWITLTACMLFISAGNGTVATGQSVATLSVYAVTYSMANHVSAIWRVNMADGLASRVFTSESIHPQTARQAFPEREYEAMTQQIAQGAFPDLIESAVKRTIEDAWALDRDQLLVLTRNEVCYRVQSTCFGFHEFLLVDTLDASATSLLQLSYHHEILDRWSSDLGCAALGTVNVAEMSPNPNQSKFAFVVKPQYACEQQRGQAFVVDYAASPVSVNIIPQSSDIAWSPDGRTLAYYAKQNCQQDSCASSVMLYAVDKNASSPVFGKLLLANFPVAIGWLDNNTLIYTWLDSEMGGEGQPVIVVQDVRTQSLKRLAYPPQPGGLSQFLYVGGQQSALFGVTFENTLVNINVSSTIKADAAIAPFPILVDAPMLYSYNARHNSYVLMMQGIEAGKITLIDAQARQTSIDLEARIPLEENEFIFSVTLGE